MEQKIETFIELLKDFTPNEVSLVIAFMGGIRANKQEETSPDKPH